MKKLLLLPLAMVLFFGLSSCATAHQPHITEQEKVERLKQKVDEADQDDNALQIIGKSPYAARLFNLSGLAFSVATGLGVYYFIGSMEYSRLSDYPSWHKDPFFYWAIAATIFQAAPFATVLYNPHQKKGCEKETVSFVALSVAARAH